MSVQSGPYQSRILGLLNRQKLKWGDRMGVARRQLKQTAIWSVQVALYPLYVLFQSARMVSTQIGQAVAFALPRLKAAVRESATAQSPKQSTPPTICILTPKQQTRLRQRLIWEVAHLARYQKLRIETRWAFNRLQPERTHPHLLPPVRWFFRLMAWVQSSPIAIATNLFQEASLLAPSTNLRLIGATDNEIGTATGARPLMLSQTLSPPLGQFYPTLGQTILRELAQTIGAIQRVNQGSAWSTQIVQTVQSVIATLRPQPSLARQAANALKAVDLEAEAAALQTHPQATPSTPSYVPDYIEAETTCIGYERSLLARILSWLDQALVWLEAQFLKLWQQVQQ